jgi:hypothetical protein
MVARGEGEPTQNPCGTGTLNINHMTGVKVASRRIREEVLATGGGYRRP